MPSTTGFWYCMPNLTIKQEHFTVKLWVNICIVTNVFQKFSTSNIKDSFSVLHIYQRGVPSKFPRKSLKNPLKSFLGKQSNQALRRN